MTNYDFLQKKTSTEIIGIPVEVIIPKLSPRAVDGGLHRQLIPVKLPI